MIIKVERSGGLTGIPAINEIDAKDLPSKLSTTAKKILTDKKLSSLQMKSMPKGAADYYSYKIWIEDGDNRRIIDCNEFNIQDDLKSLVQYIERNSRKRK